MGQFPPKDVNFRLIHHLSYPDCDSISIIHLFGQGALLAKTDMKSAFLLLHVPIYPGNFDLLGIKFDGKYYFDKCLPFGSKLSCALFNNLSTVLLLLVSKKSNNQYIIHYLDDFLLVGKALDPCSIHTLDTFHQVCAHLGGPIANEKTMEPTNF